MSADLHVHEFLGPEAICSCGQQFTVPPIAVSVCVDKHGHSIMDEVVMCQSLDEAITALRDAADQLEIARDCAVTEIPRRLQ